MAKKKAEESAIEIEKSTTKIKDNVQPMSEKTEEKTCHERDIGKVDEVELKTIEVRLNSVRDATQRSRFIFLMMTVVCASILLTLWNTTFSWAKDKAFTPKELESSVNSNANSNSNVNSNVNKKNDENHESFKQVSNIILKERREELIRSNSNISDEDLNNQLNNETNDHRDKVNNRIRNEKLRVLSNQEQAISEWIKNRTVSIGLLGIRIDATDFAVVGSFSLVVITVWFFFSVRRENRAIVTLLRDVHEDWKNGKLNLEVCKMVYYGIVNSLVFIDLRGGDAPIGGLEKPELLDNEKIQTIESNETLEKSNINFKNNTPFARKIIRFITFLPPITIFFIIATDVLSLLMISPYRDLHKPLWVIISEHNKWFEIILKISFFDGIGLVACLYTGAICIRCKRFSEKTKNTIIDFRKSTKVE